MSERLVLEQTGDGWRLAGADADRFALVNDYLGLASCSVVVLAGAPRQPTASGAGS